MSTLVQLRPDPRTLECTATKGIQRNASVRPLLIRRVGAAGRLAKRSGSRGPVRSFLAPSPTPSRLLNRGVPTFPGLDPNVYELSRPNRLPLRVHTTQSRSLARGVSDESRLSLPQPCKDSPHIAGHSDRSLEGLPLDVLHGPLESL